MKLLKQPLLTAFVLGAMTVLGFAPYYFFPAPMIALVGLFYLWSITPNPFTAFKLGFAFGLGLYLVGIYWIYISLHDFGGMPWWFAGFCTFCLCSFMALFPALVGYFSKKIGYLSWSAAMLWGISDWVRSWIFTGFPWLTLGYSQTPYSPLTGYLPIIGVYGLSVITALLAACFTQLIVNRQSAKQKRYHIIAITFGLAIGFILKVAPWTSPHGEPISVSLAQGNIAQEIKWSPNAAESTITQYIEMATGTEAELIVLPETALPVIASQLDPSIKRTFTTHGKLNQSNTIIGMVEYDPETKAYFNSAISFGADKSQYYRKNHLVPFGEFIPLKNLLGWIYEDWLNIPLSDLSRGGAKQQPMQFNDQKIAVNICYEDVFGEEIISQLPQANLLVNISNDAWYGKSYAAAQHMQFSQARAIETGRMMLRATNTGATAVIDPNGYIVNQLPEHEKGMLHAIAQGYTGSTPYVIWGNWPFIIICFSAIALLWQRKNK